MRLRPMATVRLPPTVGTGFALDPLTPDRTGANAQTAAQQKARGWVPEAMLISAVDPNGPIAPERDEEDYDEIE